MADLPTVETIDNWLYGPDGVSSYAQQEVFLDVEYVLIPPEEIPVLIRHALEIGAGWGSVSDSPALRPFAEAFEDVDSEILLGRASYYGGGGLLDRRHEREARKAAQVRFPLRVTEMLLEGRGVFALSPADAWSDDRGAYYVGLGESFAQDRDIPTLIYDGDEDHYYITSVEDFLD